MGGGWVCVWGGSLLQGWMFGGMPLSAHQLLLQASQGVLRYPACKQGGGRQGQSVGGTSTLHHYEYITHSPPSLSHSLSLSQAHTGTHTCRRIIPVYHYVYPPTLHLLLPCPLLFPGFLRLVATLLLLAATPAVLLAVIHDKVIILHIAMPRGLWPAALLWCAALLLVGPPGDTGRGAGGLSPSPSP